jgi:hypothetical protein
MDQSKEEFLEQFGADYGYPDAPRGVDEMRAADFKRLEGANRFTLLSIHPFDSFSRKKIGQLFSVPLVEKMILELRAMPISQLKQPAGVCGGIL